MLPDFNCLRRQTKAASRAAAQDEATLRMRNVTQTMFCLRAYLAGTTACECVCVPELLSKFQCTTWGRQTLSVCCASLACHGLAANQQSCGSRINCTYLPAACCLLPAPCLVPRAPCPMLPVSTKCRRRCGLKTFRSLCQSIKNSAAQQEMV